MVAGHVRQLNKSREQPEQENQLQQPGQQVTQKPELGTDMKMQGAARAGEEGWSSSHRGT